jgi:hypothetical protein
VLPNTNFKFAVGWMKPAFLAAGLLVIGIAQARADAVTGDIAVFNGSTLMGYVSDVYDGQNSFTFTTNLANALNVTIATPVSAPFAILENNPPGANQYFGAVGGSGGYYMSSSQDGYTYLSGSALLPAGSTPTSSTNDINALGYNGPDETTIWSIDGSNVLTAQWVNADSTVQSPAQTFYDPVVDFLGITGDLAGFNAQYGDGATAVTFEFTGVIPSSTPEPATGALVGIALAAAGFVRLRSRKA